MTAFLKNLDLSKINKKKKSQPSKPRAPKKRVKTPSQIKSFPVKLFGMLDAVERDGNEHIVSWHPDGKSFKVHNVKSFVNMVLPSHFKQTRYKSFQRQLNFYGFQRITSGPLEGSYKHKMFLKGEKALSKEIKRLANLLPPSKPDKDAEPLAHPNHPRDEESSLEQYHQDDSSASQNISEASEDERSQHHMDVEQESIDPAFLHQEDNSPSRRDSYTLAVEILEKSAAAPTTPYEKFPRRDSFHEAIDTFATTFFRETSTSSLSSRKMTKLRRGVSSEGRLSFVGRKFHFLPVEFTDLYGVYH